MATPRTKQDEAKLMLQLCRFIEAGSEEALTLAALAEKAGMSPFHLQRRFRAVVGVSPKEYQQSCRLKKLKAGLKGKASVTEAIFDAGYNSSSRVYGKINENLGMTPRQYRQQGEQAVISYACGKTPLGRVMIAATDRGICFIQFADSDAALLKLLVAEFPAAQLSPMNAAGEKEFARWMKALNAYLAQGGVTLDLPLDISGTAFQTKVWKYLQKIPGGKPQSYAQVAKGIGRAGSARAVARACATNRIAIAIPCHRVIRGDGGLSGYKWGVERKRKLLELEGRA
jgi:AraC family transcriptional regulator of adaptative response/methylated-DNA-[protein]-cysteine methyltransferase